MKRKETDPASHQFPKCSPPSGTQRDSESWVEKRREGERAVKPVILLPSEKWALKIGFLKVQN